MSYFGLFVVVPIIYIAGYIGLSVFYAWMRKSDQKKQTPDTEAVESGPAPLADLSSVDALLDAQIQAWAENLPSVITEKDGTKEEPYTHAFRIGEISIRAYSFGFQVVLGVFNRDYPLKNSPVRLLAERLHARDVAQQTANAHKMLKATAAGPASWSSQHRKIAEQLDAVLTGTGNAEIKIAPAPYCDGLRITAIYEFTVLSAEFPHDYAPARAWLKKQKKEEEE